MERIFELKLQLFYTTVIGHLLKNKTASVAYVTYNHTDYEHEDESQDSRCVNSH